MNEVFFQCPYCWEQISVLVDPSVPQQSYIEDCEVCCRPIQFDIHVDEGGEDISLQADSIEQ
jgi:hypothetical protein